MILGPEDFAGTWQLNRRIDDRMGGQIGQLTGIAVLAVRDTTTLDYTESGQLRIGRGPTMAATRAYVWHFSKGMVLVRFDDDRPFHSFAPIGAVAGTDHPCGADHYSVRYDFTRWPDWQAVWTVNGPRKDYTSVSHYHR